MSDSGDFQSDSFTETTHVSWLSQLGQSITGVLIGLVLVVAAVILLFWNEGRAVQTARSLVEGERLVVTGNAGAVDPANEGKLLHVSGDLTTTAPLADPDFGVSVVAARLVRVAEMYQWKEETHTETHKNLGGSEEKTTTYSYVRTWSEPRIDSSRFRQPNGHENPAMRYRGFEAAARDAKLGAFRPGEGVLRRLAANEPWRVDPSMADAVRQKVGTAQLTDGTIYIGADPSQPRIGDIRITYRIAAAGPASLIGRQTGTDFTEFQTKAGDRLLMASAGQVSADAMFKSAEDENRLLTWILRAGGIVLMFVGWALIGRPLVVVGNVVPLIGDVLAAGTGLIAFMMTAIVVPIVVAIAWFWYRPLVSVIVLAVGFGLVFGIKMLRSGRVPAKAAQAA